MIYYLVIIETDTKKTEEIQEEKYIDKSKIEPLYVYFKTIPEESDFVFKHDKLTQRNKPEHKLYTHSKKQLYFSLNKILRHFYLTEDFNKKEIMMLNYLPDNFDFNAYINNYKKLGGGDTSLYSLGDTMELNEILPNDIAKVIMELDNNLQEISETEIQRTKVTYKKNRITLKTTDNFFLNIKYTRYPKEEYDVGGFTDNIVESVVKLRQIPLEIAKGLPLKKNKKQKYVYYLKFLNDYYLCINKDMILYASKDKNFIFYFDIVPLTLTEIEEMKIK